MAKTVSNSSRAYWFSLVTYAKPTEFKYLLDKSLHWAYILHDKDTHEHTDGTDAKKDHYHIVIQVANARTSRACIRDVHSDQNTLCQVVRSPIGAYEYLIHLNDPDKYQYDPLLIVHDDRLFWQFDAPKARVLGDLDFLNDLISDDMDVKEMAVKYGRDFIKNYKSYLEFRQYVKMSDKW